MTYSSVFTSVTWLILVAFWVASASRAKKNASQEGIAASLATGIAVLAGLSSLLYRFDPATALGAVMIPRTGPIGLLGALVSAAGASFAIMARLAIGKNWSGAAITLKRGHELVQTGPYAIVRHPIYAGFAAAALGSALASGTVGASLGAILFSAALIARIPREETLMARTFPAAYPAYKRRVKAVIPFVL